MPCATLAPPARTVPARRSTGVDPPPPEPGSIGGAWSGPISPHVPLRAPVGNLSTFVNMCKHPLARLHRDCEKSHKL